MKHSDKFDLKEFLDYMALVGMSLVLTAITMACILSVISVGYVVLTGDYGG